MSIKKKIALAMGGTVLAASVVAGGTFALFTEQVTNANNQFTAGNVNVTDVTGGTSAVANAVTGFLLPGDHGTAKVSVKNTGNVPAWVRLAGIENTSGGLFQGAKPLTIDIHSGSAKLLAPNETYQFDVDYDFPLAADNSYENATGKFDIKVEAVQAENNTNAAQSGPNSWN